MEEHWEGVRGVSGGGSLNFLNVKMTSRIGGKKQAVERGIKLVFFFQYRHVCLCVCVKCTV